MQLEFKVVLLHCLPAMTKSISKLLLAGGALAIACFFSVPALRAADEKAEGAAKAEKKKKRDEENLKKYDRNANGKLDPDEEAAMKADREKMKGEKKKQKNEGN